MKIETSNPDHLSTLNNSNDYIIINNKIPHLNQFQISSKHSIFKNEYIKIDVYASFLIFTVPSIDYNGKIYKVSTNKRSPDWHYFCVVNEMLTTGKFKSDLEESNEDELLVYYS